MSADDAVYASILSRVEQSELRDQLQKVVRKEYKTINRQIRHASTSLTNLKQLQAASESLRPSGDWLPKKLQNRLKSIEKLQKQLESALEDLEKDARGKKRRKRKRQRREDTHKEVVVADKQEDSDVEILEVVPAQLRTNVDDLDEEKKRGGVERGEDPSEEVESENDRAEISVVEVEEERVESASAASKDSDNVDVDVVSEGDALPRGLVRINRDAAVHVKEELVMLPASDQEDTVEEIGVDIAESPIELEILDSSDESAIELELSNADESAVELEIPDSDAEDDFTYCVELVTNLQNANALGQMAEFPEVVELLRTYLADCKHLTVVEMDEYLFAHKRITDEEADEIGRAIETLMIIGMQLPLRAKTKMALRNLLATVEQLKMTLGGLPTFLYQVVENFKGYYVSHVDKNISNVPFAVVQV